MAFTRQCANCGREITYKSKATYNMSCKRTDEPWCKSCATKRTHAEGKLKHREVALRRSLKGKGKGPKTAEHRANIARAKREAWADPDSSYNQPEFRERLSRSHRERIAKGLGVPVPPRKRAFNALDAWALSVKERDNWTCQECGSQEKLHAHHVKRRFTHPELEESIDNGVTLCEICHAQKHPEVPWMQKILERASAPSQMV